MVQKTEIRQPKSALASLLQNSAGLFVSRIKIINESNTAQVVFNIFVVKTL